MIVSSFTPASASSRSRIVTTPSSVPPGSVTKPYVTSVVLTSSRMRAVVSATVSPGAKTGWGESMSRPTESSG